MSELYCSNCKKLLSNDEKASGKCANCGEKFSSTLIGATRPIEVNTDIATEKNIVGMVLKVIGYFNTYCWNNYKLYTYRQI